MRKFFRFKFGIFANANYLCAAFNIESVAKLQKKWNRQKFFFRTVCAKKLGR